MNVRDSLFLVIVIFMLINCGNHKNKFEWKSTDVTVTAYNSLIYQTSSHPNITAWGDTLKPGMKCIAVSRDLIEMGLTHNTIVTIDGLKGIYLVKDKMNRRWRKRIDIYLGNDIQEAKAWGKKQRKIYYRVKK